MTTVITDHVVDDDGLAALREPRTDLLTERAIGIDSWEADEGPFDSYKRSLHVVEADAEPYRVTEKTEYRLAIPLWAPLVRPLMSRALATTDRRPRRRLWWPREVVTASTARLVSTVCVISIATGYMGVVIGQTITFAARDFSADDSAEATTLAGVRVGVLLSLVLIRRADRIGRRPLILGFTSAAVVFTVLGAFSPNLVVLGATQTIARGLTTGLITLLVLAATEEVPAGVRAFTISLITISAALGAGMVLWVLPLDDVVDEGWRIVYLVSAAFLPVVWWVSRHIPETRRFTAATDVAAPARVDLRRFTLIAGAAFVSALFLSPASQLRNEFLRDDLGYNASTISLFQLVISIPAGTAVVLAGVAADRFGRRWIAAIGLSGGVIMTAVSYQSRGAGLWFAASAGIVLTAIAFPATRGYQIELFPTRARAKVGGWIDAIAVAGSAIGLVTVGVLSERWNDLGSAIGVMVIAPIIVAVVILTLFPETASTELEAFNPEDPQVVKSIKTREGSAEPR